MKNKIKNAFIMNTLFIIITNFIVKLLGLINKITITRLLGTSGMSLYVLSFPTIMLFISIAGFSLYITISKLVSEAIASKQYSPKKIVTLSIKYSLLLSFVILIIYLLLLKPLTTHLLKNTDLYYPLLAGAPLIMLVGISDGLKGYFAGIKKINIASLGNLIEQIGRISFSIIFLIIMLPHGMIVATTFTILALSAGELCTIIFTLIKIKKYPIPSYDNTTGEKKAILDMAVTNTSSRLLGNFTYFLEPILYTTILSNLGFSVVDIQTKYTIIDAYTIPLVTFISFLPFAISSAMLPYVSEANALKHNKTIEYYVKRSLLFCIIPAIILAINLFLFAEEYMYLIYKTTEGTNYIKYISFIFICYYIHVPINSILQATGHNKKVFITSSITNILRLVLLVILSYIDFIGLDSIIYATTATVVIGFLISFILLIKYTKLKLNISKILSLFLITIFTLSLSILLKNFNIKFYLILLINTVIFCFLVLKLKIIIFNKKKEN